MRVSNRAARLHIKHAVLTSGTLDHAGHGALCKDARGRRTLFTPLNVDDDVVTVHKVRALRAYTGNMNGVIGTAIERDVEVILLEIATNNAINSPAVTEDAVATGLETASDHLIGERVEGLRDDALAQMSAEAIQDQDRVALVAAATKAKPNAPPLATIHGHIGEGDRLTRREVWIAIMVEIKADRIRADDIEQELLNP